MRPIASFCAARTSIDGQYRVHFILFLVEGAAEFGIGEDFSRFGVLRIYFGLGGQAFFLKFKKALGVIYFTGQLGVVVEPVFVESDFALDGFGSFGVVPKCWV